jgi:hypothetical protein
MVIIYLAKADTRKTYFNIYAIEGETWSALLRWHQDIPWTKNRAMLWLWGGQKQPKAEAKDGRKANSRGKTKKDLMLKSKMMRSGPDGGRKSAAQKRPVWTQAVAVVERLR